MRGHKDMNARLKVLPLMAAWMLAITACSKPADVANIDAETGHGETGRASRSLKLDDLALKAAGVRFETLQPSTPEGQLRAPGEVLDSAYGMTLITPRVESLVVRRYAKLGDEVSAGTPLATLTSVAVSDAQADLRIAEQEWRRVSALGREAVAGRRISEAKVAVDRARAKAQAYGLPGTSEGSVNGQFTLRAPHAGRITSDDFVVGERIEPGKPLYRLVDESSVWVDATLPTVAVSSIAVGSRATVVVDGRRILGRVLRSAHRTSETTRNAVIRIEVPNKEDYLHAGDFVDVYLDATRDAGEALTLVVPTTALIQMEGDSVVFRRGANGVLEATPVRTAAVIGDSTVIEEGLKAGDVIVVEGAFSLKSQLLKSQLGDGHGH
ncbi:efflux RND transporter periplasmic adaptor subunit [Lysobacter sp. HDW10]|uniref:efflux RND transporter periplasmic adaptor subunit n=1 Tax=Lysobacter sp. HDW10 TaxID=2714936 RepID=UPI00140759EF|nr:efflux RND transporter periplasmic adaptor subunit [Lysobacter sp. HDW10]QIK81951.1 efflux RND transporter periplasmic adaptor subunit [Lysobacter sp. HDW10]